MSIQRKEFHWIEVGSCRVIKTSDGQLHIQEGTRHQGLRIDLEDLPALYEEAKLMPSSGELP